MEDSVSYICERRSTFAENRNSDEKQINDFSEVRNFSKVKRIPFAC